MSRRSTVPAVKRALVTLLRAATDPSTTTVWRNHENTDIAPGENIYVGDCKGTREWAQLRVGTPGVQEDYHVEVEVEVLRAGSDSEGTEDRLFALMDLIDVALLDPSIGGVNLIEWGLVESFDQTSEGGNDGWACRLILEVYVKARI